jgi:aspartyl aminopeptidase
MLPLFALGGEASLLGLIAREAGVEAASVIGHDLFVYNRQAPSVWGA